MSQRITITNIQEKKSKDGSKTFYIVTDENKTDWSTFDAELSQLPIGSVIDLEPKVVGKYNNIESYKLVSKPDKPVAPIQPEPKQYGKSIEALQLELDAKARNTALMQACEWFDDKEARVEDALRVANQFYHWLKTGQYLAVTTTTSAVKDTAKPLNWDDTPDKAEIKFANIGELFTKCWNERKIARPKVLELAGVKSDSEIKDYMAVYQKVVEYSENLKKGA